MALMETTGGQVLARPGVNSVYTSTITTTTYYLIYQYTRTSTDTTTTFTIPIPTAYDLTQMFGSGKEPTASQFFSMFPSDYYPYNEGTLISCGPTAVVSTGFNLWDEEWEAGCLDVIDGQNKVSGSQIRTKNFIPILPNTEYYKISPNNGMYWVCYYDADKNYIGYLGTGFSGTFTPMEGASYMRSYTESGYGTTYKNDICFNVSSTLNGQYKPYQTPDTMDLSWIRELTYNDGTQDVQMFPNGLCSAGTVYDEVTPTKAIKRIGVIDMGTLSWGRYHFTDNFWTFYAEVPLANNRSTGFYSNQTAYPYTSYSGNVSPTQMGDKTLSTWTNQNYVYARDDSFNGDNTAFKNSLSGEYLYYEFKTPIENSIIRPMGYAVQPGGTEQLLPENQPGQTPTTTQIIMDVTYPLDAVGTLQNLPNNYTSLQVMDNFASSIAQALTSAVGATSITRNSNGTWTITITPAS